MMVVNITLYLNFFCVYIMYRLVSHFSKLPSCEPVIFTVTLFRFYWRSDLIACRCKRS